MKFVRVPFAVSLALLAAAPAQAVALPAPPKPPAAGPADPDRESWRNAGISTCVGEMLSADGVTPTEVRDMCGCAVDRFAANARGAAPPAIDPGIVRAQLGGPLIACAARERPGLSAALAARLARPALPVVPSDESKPVDTPAPAESADAPKRSGPDLQAWLDGLSLPSWLTDSGMPVWAWAMLGLLAFLFLRGLLRGGDQRDLIGPPPHMRLGTRANPPAPRRADPPQRS